MAEIEFFGDSKLDHALKKCPGCGWTGYRAKRVTCFECEESFYVCPICGKRVVIYEEVPFLFPSAK